MASPLSVQRMRTQQSSGVSTSHRSSGIPVPPRLPQQGQRGRAHAGSILPGSPTAPEDTCREWGHGGIRVVESEVYDMWGNTGCRIRRKGRMWMSLLTRRQLGRIGCCAVRGRIRGRRLVLRTSTLSGHRQSQESREPFTFGELVRISVVAVMQRVEYFVECEVKDTVADARDWGGVTLALELVQTAIRSRANSSMARLGRIRRMGGHIRGRGAGWMLC